jgi:hypothetical protein
MGLSIEASNWALVHNQLQTAADAAAFGGAQFYGTNPNARNTAVQAANIAQENDIAGSASPVWSSDSNTLTSNQVMVTIGAGALSASNTSVTVKVSKTVPSAFSMLVGGPPTTVLSVTSVAESVVAMAGAQPCLVALGKVGNSISVAGSASITGNNCSLRSNGNADFAGSYNISAAGVYAAGTIHEAGSGTITGGQIPNAGTIGDPYQNFTVLQNALMNDLTPGSGTAVEMDGSGSMALSPGVYSGMIFSGSVEITLAAGLYVVNGDINMAGSGTITGTGVTIISSGKLSVAGSGTFNLTAPTSSTTSGGIPGVVFASTTTGTSGVAGSGVSPITGAFYAPNGAVNWVGSSSVNGCTQLIANTIAFVGSSSLTSNCANYGLPSFGSFSTANSAQLVR